MSAILVLSVSVVFQFMAAFFALRLVKVTGKMLCWMLISVAFFLMAVRRLIPLCYSIFTTSGYSADLTNESIGLVLSLLMLLGVMGIAPMFTERKRVELKLRDQTKQLNSRMMELEEKDETIRRLSTPLTQVWEGVVMIPIIGVLDSVRAKQLTDSILNHIMKTKTEIVILSIEGIASIDTETANHILRTIDTVKLMGSEMIVTGVRPDVATALVSLGIDLSSIVTRSTLREGLNYAFAKLGMKTTQSM
jgi:anti-anti-sigma regulatory factor